MILDRVQRYIDDCIAAGAAGAIGAASALDAGFEALALEVFAHQYEHVPLYRRLCELRGKEPAAIAHWTQIPAAPADLFKEDLSAAGISADSAAAVFLSSGTTQGAERRSRHVLGADDLALYHRSSLAHFGAMVLPDSPGPMSILVAGPTGRTHPQSSLGHMYGFIEDACGVAGERAPTVFSADGRLDLDAAVAWLEQAAATTRPVLVLALTSTLTAIFDALRDRRLALRLPADSRVVHTGGSKGGRTLSRAGIRKASWRFLHIPAYLSIEEYGMTELVSQFYDDSYRSRWSGKLAPRSKVGPAWTRTLVVDPATLAPVARGERGILRHVDLANCSSVSAVQTLDIGVESGNGFEVLGRATGAEARGCSQLMSVLQESISGDERVAGPAAGGGQS